MAYKEKSPIPVVEGGSGAVTLTGVLTGNGTSAITANTVTQHGVLLGGASNAVSSLGVATNGQVLLGATGADPSFVTPTVGTGLAVTTNSTTLSYALSTPVSIANGGTNATSMATTDGVVYYDGTRLVTTTAGSATQVLTSNGPGVAPTFQAAASGGITTLAGDSGTATGSTVTIAGGSNISTSAASSTVTVALASSPSVSGSLTAGTTITSTNGAHSIGNTAASTAAAELDFKKSRSGGAITSGDGLALISIQGHDGSGYITASQITSTNSGTVAANRIASDLKFYTHPDSTAASTLRMTIAPTGAVTIAAPDSGTGLTVSGGGETITSGDLTITANNINLAATTSSTTGSVYIDGARYIHAYGATNDLNIFVGRSSGNYTLTTGTAIANAICGVGGFPSLTTGERNSSIGALSGNNIDTGSRNSICGQFSLYGPTSASDNCILGYQCLNNIATGTYNIAIGSSAGSSMATGGESHNILLNSAGVSGESNTLHIGSATGTSTQQLNKALICGITGKTSTSGVAVLVNSSNVLGTTTSSIRYKERIEDIGLDSEKLYDLRPVSFHYKDEIVVERRDDNLKQYGLIAEEVKPYYPELITYDKDGEIDSIRYHMLYGLMLNEIQKLNKRISVLEELLIEKG